jgi:polysaccharide deacetylase
MTMIRKDIPLLPLVLDDIPRGLRQALVQEGIPVRDRRPGPPEGRFVLFDSRTETRWALSPGQVAVDVDRLRKGWNEDPLEMLSDGASSRYEWEIDGLTLTEEIARVDKRHVRRKVLDRLRRRIEASGGIWLRLSPFPFPNRSAFNFRIDYDAYDPHDFQATLEAIAGHRHATSHFINGAAYEPHPEALQLMRGLDVGSHGYWHHTYQTVDENLRNMRRGIDTLRSAQIEPSGFVAPLGRFNEQLLQALRTLGIGHSSEFALAHDELPFFPTTGNLLQIPINPFCLGLFLEAAERSGMQSASQIDQVVDVAGDYFDQVIRSKYRLGEPIFLYGHPTGRVGRYPQLLHRIFDTVAQFGSVWETTLTEFADWWRVRAQARLSVKRERGRFVVRIEQQPDAYQLGIEFWRGAHVALLPMRGRVVRFSPSTLAYEKRTDRPPFQPVRIDRPEGLKGRVRRLIDWERVTPIEEIGSGNLRNWAKRTLRKMWE